MSGNISRDQQTFHAESAEDVAGVPAGPPGSEASLAETEIFSDVRVRWDDSLEIALAALTQRMVTLDQVQAAADARRRARPPIGKLALSERKLSMTQVFEILTQQGISGKLFGEIAVELGFLDSSELHGLLQRQATLTPTLSDVLVSQGVLAQEQAEMLRQQWRSRLRSLAEPETALLHE